MATIIGAVDIRLFPEIGVVKILSQILMYNKYTAVFE
jgi:hypothetical protein